ncbi:MAG: excinuclease ABC subunit UvrC [Acidimicrobiales bacterium]
MERPAPSSIPAAPGSYQFKDGAGRVIYVGKAASLRSRVTSYFQSPEKLGPRTAQMMAEAASVEWIQVRNEVEALMLEYNLIKAHKPRFNLRLRDDKSYPYLAVTVADEWPRPVVMRGERRKGTRYFGPYAQAYAIRETLDLLLRSFPLRTCSDHKMQRHARLGRPCLLYHIEKCSAPCTGEIGADAYATLVSELVSFLEGDTDKVVARIESQMAEAASGLDFERAAVYRDRLSSLRKVLERQQMVTMRAEDLDVVGIAEDELEAVVQVFFVRHGRVVGRKAILVDKVEDVSTAELLSRVLQRLYADAPLGVPRQVLVPVEPADAGAHCEWLSGLRGSRVTISVPRRGDKRALGETVRRNAAEELSRNRLRRASDHNSRARALRALQEALGLPEAPLRIECYDMSHLQGSDYVGSMVVMEDGLAKRSDYRRFKIKGGQGNDDYAAMEQVLTRRLSAPAAESSRRKRFAYPPQLIVVDGGKGQLGVAVKVLSELGLSGEISLCGLAKEFEEVFVPGRAEPIRIPRTSEALYLLQRVRDEAHRFAIGYHRQLRSKRTSTSALEGIPGLGPVRRKRLLAELGGLAAIQSASPEQLLALAWLPERVGREVHARLSRSGGAS